MFMLHIIVAFYTGSIVQLRVNKIVMSNSLAHRKKSDELANCPNPTLFSVIVAEFLITLAKFSF